MEGSIGNCKECMEARTMDGVFNIVETCQHRVGCYALHKRMNCVGVCRPTPESKGNLAKEKIRK